MQKKFKALISVIMVAISFPLWADQKIAVININAALVGSSLAQSEITALQESAEFVGLRAKLESAASDFQILGKELEEKRLTWSAEQVAEHQKKMAYLQEDAQSAQKKLETENKLLQQRIQQKVNPAFQTALIELIDEEGITLLLDAKAVLHASPETNITAKVVDRINKGTSRADPLPPQE